MIESTYIVVSLVTIAVYVLKELYSKTVTSELAVNKSKDSNE